MRVDRVEDSERDRPDRVLRRAIGDVEAALAAYEQALFPRSAEAAAESARVHQICFGDNTPQSLVDFFTGTKPAE